MVTQRDAETEAELGLGGGETETETAAGEAPVQVDETPQEPEVTAEGEAQTGQTEQQRIDAYMQSWGHARGRGKEPPVPPEDLRDKLPEEVRRSKPTAAPRARAAPPPELFSERLLDAQGDLADATTPEERERIKQGYKAGTESLRELWELTEDAGDSGYDVTGYSLPARLKQLQDQGLDVGTDAPDVNLQVSRLSRSLRTAKPKTVGDGALAAENKRLKEQLEEAKQQRAQALAGSGAATGALGLGAAGGATPDRRRRDLLRKYGDGTATAAERTEAAKIIAAEEGR